jgi:hypothetical protein
MTETEATMSDGVQRRLVLLPGAVEREEETQPSPEEAVGRVLAANVHGPGLLSEARYRVVMARNTVVAATQATRVCRDTELAYELACRRSEPRSANEMPFAAAAAVLAALLGVACVIGLVLVWPLPWLYQAALVVGTAALGGVLAWSAAGRRNSALGLILAGLGMCVVLVALSVLWTTGSMVLRVGEAVALGIALAATAVAAVLVFERAESWHCYRTRKAYRLAVSQRQGLVTQVSVDEQMAETALGAWISLVVEECQLAHPGGTDGTPWVQACANAARKTVTSE